MTRWFFVVEYPDSRVFLFSVSMVEVYFWLLWTCSDFGAKENIMCHCFPIYLPWSDGTRCHDVCFRMLSFKAAFSLSSFIFIRRLFSSFSLSAIKVVSSAYLRMCIFLLAILTVAWKKNYGKFGQCIKKHRHHFADKDPYSQSYGLSGSHVQMLELDHKESWPAMNWCFECGSGKESWECLGQQG